MTHRVYRYKVDKLARIAALADPTIKIERDQTGSLKRVRGCWMHGLQQFIEGRFISGAGDHSICDLNPSDASDVIAEAPHATTDEVDAAVSAAFNSSVAWRFRLAMARVEILYRRADVLVGCP